MSRTICLSWVLAGSLASGPGFLLGLVFGLWSKDMTRSIAMPEIDAGSCIAVLVLSMLVGAVIAIVPALCGTAAMQWLGRHSWLARMTQVWVLVGGALPGLIVSFWSPDPETTSALVGAGAVCAFFCRRGARWPRPDAEGDQGLSGEIERPYAPVGEL